MKNPGGKMLRPVDESSSNPFDNYEDGENIYSQPYDGTIDTIDTREETEKIKTKLQLQPNKGVTNGEILTSKIYPQEQEQDQFSGVSFTFLTLPRPRGLNSHRKFETLEASITLEEEGEEDKVPDCRWKYQRMMEK